MPAPFSWMIRWQETPDDPILEQPASCGGEDDAASEDDPRALLPQSTESDIAPARAEDVTHA